MPLPLQVGSTRQVPMHVQMVGGVNGTITPVLLTNTMWSYALNWRFRDGKVLQVPRLVSQGVVATEYPYPVLLLVSLPCGIENYCALYALTSKHVFRVNLNLTTTKLLIESTTEDIVMDGEYRRWATTIYNNQLYLSNELNPLRCLDAGVLNCGSLPQPTAKYLATYYDHIVALNCSFQGNYAPSQIRWSDLYRWDVWTPARDNEADLFDAEEWDTENTTIRGGTGLGKINNVLFAYFPTAILRVDYVGKPGVMRVTEKVTGRGNTLPWALAVMDKAHFFIDTEELDFFRFNGENAEPIGAPVRDQFFSELNTDPTQASKTYSYIDKQYSEIAWVYVSTNSSFFFDRKVVYNYKEGKWYFASVEGYHCFHPALNNARQVDQIANQVDSLVGSVDRLVGAVGSVQPRL